MLFFSSKPTPDSLVKHLKDLPPAPKVMHRMRALIGSANAGLDDIAKLIALEPGLSARVVRMANSTRFSGATRVGNVLEAIQRVGLSSVQEVVTYAIASQLVGQPLPSYKLDANTLWFRAVACALAASSLSKRNGVDEGQAYTAGLMHGIGLLVLDKYSTDKDRGKHVFKSSGYPLDFSVAEIDYVGFNHADAGAALLRLWGFDEAVCEAVLCQIEPETSMSARKLCMTLATARWARSLFCVSEEKIPDLPPGRWLEESGISISGFSDWLSEVRANYNVARTELTLF